MTISLNSKRPPVQHLDPNLIQDADLGVYQSTTQDLKEECRQRIFTIFESIVKTSQSPTEDGRVGHVKDMLPLLERHDRWIREWELKDVSKIIELERSMEISINIDLAILRNLFIGLNENRKLCAKRYVERLNQISQEDDLNKRADLAKDLSRLKNLYDVSYRVFRAFYRMSFDGDLSKPTIWHSFVASGVARHILSLGEVDKACRLYFDSIDAMQANQEVKSPRLTTPRSLKTIKFDETANVRLIPITHSAKEEFDRLYNIHQKIKVSKRSNPAATENRVISAVERTLKQLAKLIIQQEPGFHAGLKELDPSLFKDVQANQEALAEADAETKAKLHDVDKKYDRVVPPSSWHMEVKQLVNNIAHYEAWIQNIVQGIEKGQ